MAGERYFWTRPYNLDSDAVASTDGSSVGSNTPAKAADNSRVTFWETTDATPQLKFDLSTAQEIDSVWFMGSNVAEYRLFYSTDDVTYNPAFAATADAGHSTGANLFVSFAAQTARYWRLDVTQETTPATNTRIFEVLLMKLEKQFDEAEALGVPEQIIEDRGGGIHVLADGSAASYSGMNDDPKERWRIPFSFATQAERDSMYAVWKGPPRRPCITASLFFDDYPDRVYPFLWESMSFEFSHSLEFSGSGFNGEIVLVGM